MLTTDTSTVTGNYTICITLPIREKAHLKPQDKVVLSVNEQGEIRITKMPKTLRELSGHGKDVFKALGGGEAFIKKERASWE